jgi:hypothetical protein
MKLISLMSALILFSYTICLSAVELATDIKAQLKDSQERSRDAQSWLRNHDEIYQGGSCVKPYVSKTTTSTVCNSSEKKETAIALCAARAGGCNFVADKLGEQLDSATARFLSSQACSATVAKVSGDSYGFEQMLETFAIDAVDATADSLMESDSKLFQILGTLGKGALLVKAAAEFSKCIDSIELQVTCSDVSSVKWERSETEDFHKCNKYVEQLSEIEKEIPILEGKLSLVKLVESYYIDLNRGDARSAFSKWDSQSLEKNSGFLTRVIEGIEYFKINELGLESIEYDTAKVLVNTTGKQRKRSAEDWLVSVSLHKLDTEWKIFEIKGIKKNGVVPKQPDGERKAPESTVRQYFSALDKANTNIALSMWKSLSTAQKRRLKTIIDGIEQFHINEAQLITLDSDTSRVFVDVTGKQKGRSSERWTGSIMLELLGEEWKISEMNLKSKTK